MSNESSISYAIKELLDTNQISHLNLLNFVNTLSEENVRLEHVLKILRNVEYFQKKWFNNIESKEYIQDNYKRVDKLRQYVCKWLIENNYKEFWIVQDIPLAVECYIRNVNEIDTEIDDILTERIKRDAKQKQKTYQEIIEEIKNKYCDK